MNENLAAIGFVPVSEINKTGTWRTQRPFYLSQGAIPPCTRLCPIFGDVREFIGLFAKNLFVEAWENRVKDNPFPSVCGRVCYHSCTKECSRAMLDEEVNIPLIEKALGDWAIKYSLSIPRSRPIAYPEKVAVIGGGPAGLSCAYHLRRSGFQVTVFEAYSELGGLMCWGIPSYRLDPLVTQKEIQRIISLGIDAKTSHFVTEEEFKNILERFDAVFVATGALSEKILNIFDSRSDRVVGALEFLKKNRSGFPLDLGQKVAVIGGGNTAIDSARTAIRLKSVIEAVVIYRRSRKEMPASDEEIKAAEEEGIKFLFLASPVRAVFEEGIFLGLECVEMALGEPDETGRQSPIPKEGSEFFVAADAVISATGQGPDFSLLKDYPDYQHLTDKLSFFEEKRIFFGGDAISRDKFLAQAIGSGRIGASRITKFLGRVPEDDSPEILPPTDKDQININYFDLARKLEIIHRVPHERIRDFKETATDRLFVFVKEEASRCFQCGICTRCDNCFRFCPDVAVKKLWGHYAIDYDFCKGCGICVEECPRAAMAIKREGK